MPFFIDIKKDISKLIGMIEVIIIPITMSLSMPNFVSHLVFEKERKLIDNMKTNGLKMRNYWTVNCLYAFLVYMASVFVWILYGRYVIGSYSVCETYAPLFIRIFGVYGVA